MNRKEAGKLGWRASKDILMELHRKKRAYLEACFRHEHKRCPSCKQSLTFEKRHNTFCGYSCRNAFFNQKRTIARKCSRCLATFFRTKSASRSVLCADCRPAAHQRALTYESIKGPVTRKAWLLRERGHKCEGCKRKTWKRLPIPLELDHIDGNSDNHVRKNVRLLCPNCHAQTPTYKARNKGRGRIARRLRAARDYRRILPVLNDNSEVVQR
jgi:hypothetical protein